MQLTRDVRREMDEEDYGAKWCYRNFSYSIKVIAVIIATGVVSYLLNIF